MSTPATTTAQPGDPSGRTLGGFVVLHKLGEGGFGSVYLAEQPVLQRRAVVKIMRGDKGRDPSLTQRFLREARVASQLDHPYAAHVYAFGAEDDGLLWIAMEHVRGTPLHTFLSLHGPLPLDRFTPLFGQLCEVVHTAHEQGIVHRDIKPANVMVIARAGRLLPKLLDFGIAKVAGAEPHATTAGAVLPAFLDLPLEGDVTETATGGPVGEGSDRAAARLGLTLPGQVIGSPHFMAPEQWSDAAGADARTDIYALGALAFEALTGRHVFLVGTMRELYEAHLRAPPPPLGPAFPAALDGVLARALAKQPADRFTSALELAEAFRAAAGTKVAQPIARLDEAVRDRALAAAPQPIAEAVARLDAARNPHQARDAVWQVGGVAARWLGLVGLACRSRLAPSRDLEELAALVRALRRRTLSDEEWLQVARLCCRPFADRAEAFPIPSLVQFFFAAPGEGEGGAAHLERLLGLAAHGRGGATEEEARAELGEGLRALVVVLGALSFLADYPLVVPRGGACERWMGIRRAARPVIQVRADALADGRPLLVDGQGAPLLSLWPLLSAAPPAPGAPDELFLLEGPARGGGGARLVALPEALERADEHVWEWLAARLLDPGAAPAGAPSDETAPWPGLASYSSAEAGRFVGREREVEALVNRLRLQALVTLVGPSGAGKSSLVQAGVVPSLPPAWRALAVRPGAQPIAALAARLAREGADLSDVGEALRSDPGALGAALRRRAERTGETLLLFIDQFEEVFTLCPSADERRRFAAALGLAAASPDDPVRVVIAVRDDFLLRLQQLPPLPERLAQGLHLLAPPAPDDLARILVEPARRAGYDFDDPALPSEMAAAVADQPGALALLSFTASKLWELRDRHFRRLTRSAYAALQGVGGALAQHAEETLAALPAVEQRLVREAFRHLVTGEGTRAVVRREELLRLLGGDRHATTSIERLVAARLLVASEGDAGEERIEVIHEALLGAWPRLALWRREDSEGTRLRDQLRVAARQWAERGRPDGLVWRGEALAEYRRWRARHPGPLTDEEEGFERAILAAAARSRRSRWLAFAAPLVALSIGLVAATISARRERAAAHEAGQRLLALYEEEGRQLLLAGDPVRALAYLDEALQGGKDGPALRFLVARAAGALAAQRHVLAHQSRVREAAFSPDGALVATAGEDATLGLWDTRTGRLVRSLRHPAGVATLAFRSDGRRLLTTCEDNAARVWDTATGALLFTLTGHTGKLGAGAWSPRGARLATTADDGTTRVWDAQTGHLLFTLAGDDPRVRSASFSPDEERLLTAGLDRRPVLWDARTGRRLLRLALPADAPDGWILRKVAAPTSKLAAPSFSADGERVLAPGLDHAAHIFRAADGALLVTLAGHGGQVRSAAFSPAGDLVVTASNDRTARIWDARTGRPVATLTSHREPVNHAAFSPDGARVFTAGDDGVARVWSRDGELLSTLVGHLGRISAGAFAPDGRLLVTAGDDATARVWDLARHDFALSLPHPRGAWFVGHTDNGRLLTASDDGLGRIFRAAPASGDAALERSFPIGAADNAFADRSRDGSRMLVGAGPSVRVLDTTDGHTLRELPHLPESAQVHFASFSPDDRRVVVAGADGAVAIYDAATARPLATLAGHSGDVYTARWSRDGASILTGGNDQTVRVWDAATGRLLFTLAGHRGPVFSGALSPDGARAATVGADQAHRLWDVARGRLLFSAEGHRNQVNLVDFSPGGELIVTVSYDRTARIWDAEGGVLLAVVPAGRGHWAEFSPDGAHVAIAIDDGPVRVWPTGLDRRSAAQIHRFVRCRVPFRVVARGLLPQGTDPAACD